MAFCKTQNSQSLPKQCEKQVQTHLESNIILSLLCPTAHFDQGKRLSPLQRYSAASTMITRPQKAKVSWQKWSTHFSCTKNSSKKNKTNGKNGKTPEHHSSVKASLRDSRNWKEFDVSRNSPRLQPSATAKLHSIDHLWSVDTTWCHYQWTTYWVSSFSTLCYIHIHWLRHHKIKCHTKSLASQDLQDERVQNLSSKRNFSQAKFANTLSWWCKPGLCQRISPMCPHLICGGQ